MYIALDVYVDDEGLSGVGCIIVSLSVDPDLDFLTPVIIVFTAAALTTAVPPAKKDK